MPVAQSPASEADAPADDEKRRQSEGGLTVDPRSALEKTLEEQRAENPFQRDPEFLQRWVHWLSATTAAFDPTVRGVSRLPEHGPMLVIANHSGGMYTPDSQVLMKAWFDTMGTEEPFYMMGMDMLFAVPAFRPILRRAGALPASMANAAEAIERGGSVLAYPGGEWEVHRPFTERNLIDFKGRKGFLRLAIRKGVPIVPVVSHGGHHTMFIVSRGERLAAALGLDRIRMETLPISVGFPFGIGSAFAPNLPVLTKITVEFLDPIQWDLPPEAADDDDILQACYEEVTDAMQRKLYELAGENPNPVLTRYAGLARRGIRFLSR